MKLYMKQKVFSWTDKFSIRDEWEQDCYFVEGELFSWGKKLHVYDRNGREVAYLQQKVWSFLTRFYVWMDGRQVAEIVREFTFLKPRYSIHGPDWEASGDFWQHDFSISCKGSPVAAVHKVWLSWGDSYEIDIAHGVDTEMTLAVVLAIDAVMEAENASAAASCN